MNTSLFLKQGASAEEGGRLSQHNLLRGGLPLHKSWPTGGPPAIECNTAVANHDTKKNIYTSLHPVGVKRVKRLRQTVASYPACKVYNNCNIILRTIYHHTNTRRLQERDASRSQREWWSAVALVRTRTIGTNTLGMNAMLLCDVRVFGSVCSVSDRCRCNLHLLGTVQGIDYHHR